MTPLLLSFGIYCHLIVILTSMSSYQNAEKGRVQTPAQSIFFDGFLSIHLFGVLYFWAKVSDLWLGWSA